MSAAFAAAALLAQGVAAPMLALNALVLGDCIPPNRLHAHRQLRARQFTNELESRLIADLEAAPAGTRAVVIDVGANNGYWSRSWFEIQQKATRDGKQLDVFMIEPQPHFLEALTKQARECNATFIPAAASTVKGHAVFETERPGSDRARLAHMDGHAGIDGKTRTTHRVQTIDLAAFVLDQLAPRRTKTHAGTEKDARHRAGERRPAPKAASLSLMKLDVEGHEYHLLPALIASGALCREWHLNFVVPERRLSALGLRLAFGSLLEHGCGSLPLAVYHDEYVANNLALPVPGLAHVAQAHSSWSEKSRGGVRRSSLTTGQENADFAHFAEARTAPRARCGERPKCSGICLYEDLACDVNQTETAYLSMVSNKVPVVEVGLLVPPETLTPVGRKAQMERGLLERNWNAAACSCKMYPAAASYPPRRRPPLNASLNPPESTRPPPSRPGAHHDTRSRVMGPQRRGNAIQIRTHTASQPNPATT